MNLGRRKPASLDAVASALAERRRSPSRFPEDGLDFTTLTDDELDALIYLADREDEAAAVEHLHRVLRRAARRAFTNGPPSARERRRQRRERKESERRLRALEAQRATPKSTAAPERVLETAVTTHVVPPELAPVVELYPRGSGSDPVSPRAWISKRSREGQGESVLDLFDRGF